ncbi:hypothetical protein ABEP18_21100 [Priestia megaterium]
MAATSRWAAIFDCFLIIFKDHSSVITERKEIDFFLAFNGDKGREDFFPFLDVESRNCKSFVKMKTAVFTHNVVKTGCFATKSPSRFAGGTPEGDKKGRLRPLLKILTKRGDLMIYFYLVP